MGGIVRGEIIPGGAGTQLPEDGVEDAAGGLGRPAGALADFLGEQGLDEILLIVGKVHGLK
jgi:hypothetical protein